MPEVSETELLAACRAGRVLECGEGGTRRVVAAGLLRHCCHELKAEVDPRGLRLSGAAITGPLELAGLDVPFPLRFDDCEFSAPVIADGARLQELAMTRCARLPGLLANGLRVRRDLDLSGSRITGAHVTSASTSKRSAVWLCESDIGGRLLCVGTVILAGGERSIQADRMHVGGNIRLLHEFTARGEIRMIGARIEGSLDITGASIEPSTGAGLVLDLSEAVIEGSMFLINGASGRNPTLRGRIDMGGARIAGQFLMRHATLEERGAIPADSTHSGHRVRGTALNAPRLSVGAELTLEGSCRVAGGIDLSMSELSSLAIGSGCSLHAPGRTALDLTNAEVHSTLTIGSQVHVEGTVRLSGSRIHGNLCLRGASLSAPEGRSLIAAQGVTVDGEAELQRLSAAGGDLGFRAASIGSFVDASGALLANPGGYTLSLHQANVKGSVWLTDGFESAGVVNLDRAVIEGRLQCTRGSFTCPAPNERSPGGHAIEAVSATIRGGMDLGWRAISPSVDFTNTRTSFLADDPAAWPPRFAVSGLDYDRFERPLGSTGLRRTWDHRARSAWLGRQVAYDAGPYEQAARVFRQHGYTDGAKAIQIAQRRHARQALSGRWSRPLRALDAAYSVTVGYGYRPGRVLWLLAALLILVTATLETPGARAAMRATSQAGIVYTTEGPIGITSTGADACGDGQVRCFNPLLYAIDTVVPLVSLDQRSTWYADANAADGTLMEWLLNAATVLGWLLSSIFVLALASLARSA